MKGHIKYVVKGVCLILLVLLFMRLADRVLIPKYYYNNKWSTTATYHGFYEIKDDTVDVLFLGSSHAACAFNPQVLYNEYGITSYNLGCEQQNLLLSYYWLKEALRSQKPRAVVLDSYILFEYKAGEALNTEEACTRKAVDVMKWGEVKRETIQAICRNDSEQTESSYYFPNLRFHTRWSELGEDDFTYTELEGYTELKGYNVLLGYYNRQDYAPMEEAEMREGEPAVPLMVEYLQKIVDLCAENEIELILVKTPTTKQTWEKHNTVESYAREAGVQFYDFNIQELYGTCNFDFASDMADDEHANVSGANKLTEYMGEILSEKCGITKHVDAQWADTDWFYQNISKDFKLHQEQALCAYLSMLNDERYSVFMAVDDEAANGLIPEAREKLAELGLVNGSMLEFGNSYLAAITEDGTVEERGNQELLNSGAIRNGRVTYEIMSKGYNSGSDCSIKINGTEYAKKKRGINIVVYDNLTRKVIDTVSFDTWEINVYR